MSVVPLTETFCTITSMMTFASASAVKMRDAVPGELRLAEGAAEEAGLDGVADVLDRPRRGGDRDAVAVGDVTELERARAVDPKSRP